MQDRFAEGLLQTLIEIGPKILEDSHYDTRANLMSSSMGTEWAGGRWRVPQDWSTHLIGHELTALHGIDHARTLAIVLPANLQVVVRRREKLLQYAARVWQIVEGDEEQCIDRLLLQYSSLLEQLGLPTRLSDYGLGETDIEIIITRL